MFIIYVDDTRELLDTTVFLLNRLSKHETIGFSNPMGALEYIKNERQPDVLISDYKMPEMNGVEFVGKVHESFSEIPVIFYSGSLPFLSGESNLPENSLWRTKGGTIHELIDDIQYIYEEYGNPK